jgi:hypothetical protein
MNCAIALTVLEMATIGPNLAYNEDVCQKITIDLAISLFYARENICFNLYCGKILAVKKIVLKNSISGV